MRLKKLKIIFGLFSRTFYFDDNYNLIYSKKNSVGKTTLLRALLYSMGFNIPNTKNFKFEECKFELTVVTDSNKELLIKRGDAYGYVQNITDNKELYFSIPANVQEMHSLIFGNNNKNIIDNILAPMYVDQEKGWTLLNRGVVIGSIRFNIDKFIQGIGDINCFNLYEELSYIEFQIKKYRSMLSVANYQNQINKLNKITEYDSYNDKLEKEIALLEFEKRPLIIEQERLQNVLRNNMGFRKYITDMKLHVIDENGNRIPVNEKTIEGFRDNVNYIAAKINIVNSKISNLDKMIQTYKHKQIKNNLLFQTDTEDIIAKFDSDISKININYISVENMIKNLEQQRTKLKSEVAQKTKSNNQLISELHNYISCYAKEMGVDERYVSASNDYIFTSDLKSLSGAIFHCIVFAFRLAYIKILEDYKHINVPIILDSPRGKEVDDLNVHKMIEILKRDFANHQLLIASIYNYDIDNLNIIELNNCLMEDFD